MNENQFQSDLRAVKTREEFDRLIAQYDPCNYLADFDPEYRAAFFIANCMFSGGAHDPQSYIAYVHALDKHYPGVHVEEEYGGVSFHGGKQCLLSTLEFNLSEHGAYSDVPYWTDAVFIAMHAACLKLGMQLPPTLREFWRENEDDGQYQAELEMGGLR